MSDNVQVGEDPLDEYTSNGILDNLLQIITESEVKTEHDTSIEKCKVISQFDGLCDEIFERYRIFLRNTYNKPLNRITHEWNIRDKKALHLDWMHNIKDYDNWIPPNRDDFRFHFYSNLPFSSQHVLQSTLQNSIRHVKILSGNIINDWLPIFTIYNNIYDNKEKSVAKIILVNMKKKYKDNVSSDKVQIRCDGLKLNMDIELTSPRIEFEDVVESIDISKYTDKCYLLAVKLRNDKVELHNISDFINQSVKQLLEGVNVSTDSIKTSNQDTNCTDYLPVKFIYSSNANNILFPSHVASIDTKFQNISIYPIVKTSETEFNLDHSGVITIKPSKNHYFTDFSTPICLYGNQPIIYTVDTEISLKMYQISNEREAKLAMCISIPEEIQKHTLGTYYKHALKVDVNLRFPNLIAVGGVTENIWIFDIIKVMCSKFGIDTTIHTTYKSNNNNNRGKVNIDYDNTISGMLGGVNKNQITRDVYHCVIKPYLPIQVYNHFGNLHPIVKLSWIRGADTLLGVQYGKFMNVQSNYKIDPMNKHSVWAIWNVAKDVVNPDDAIMRNKYWIISSNVDINKPVNNSRLVALYNGHFDSESGVLATDFKWSNELGLLVVSSDSTKQLHLVKPAIWAWCDCDDEYALARLEGDVNFFKNSLRYIQELSSRFCSDDSSIDSTRLRKTKSRFIAIEKEATFDLNNMEYWVRNPLKLEFLPEWYRKQITLPSDRDKSIYKFT